MAAPGKQTSRWGVGAFLQQAVAGVESRLDTILADDQEAGKAANAAAATPVAAPKPDTSTPRSANSNRTNERLQERLARAMAAKNAQKADSSMATPPRTDSPTQFTESLRQSFDMACTTVEREASTVSTEEVVESWPNQQSTPSNEVENSTIVSIPLSGSTQEPSSLTTQVESEDTACLSVDSARPSIPRDSMDSVRQPITSSRPFMEYPTTQISDVANHKAPEEYEELLKQLQSDFEISELQKHEEIHDYVERVDALQAKLQYLAKESADNAKTASNAAASGSLEKKVADKDEQIALLMEEGQKLSKKELSHLSAIKKLRSKIQENGKELAEAKLGQDKAEKDAAFANDRLKRAEGFERRVTEKERQINQLQKDLESARTERVSRDATIATLKRQLEDAAAENKKAEVKTAHESLVTERKKVADLEDNIANLKIEKSLIADRGQLQVKELRERIDKDAETARMLELEMRSEHQMLESKLEVMRARAEEVTTGATGDAQAKLLRQIETLQTQYAVASENWQGIEASLIARAASLEKERDEATKRETDIRRKAREVTLKAKRNEDELEESRSKLPSFQEELAAHKAKLDALQKRAEESETALIDARAKFEQEKQLWQSDTIQRIDEEREKWQEEAAVHGVHNRSEGAHSPVVSSRRGMTSEYLGLQNLQIRRTSARSINSDVPTVDRLMARRPSPQPLRSSGHGTPIRQDSIQSTNTNGERSSFVHADQDDFFDQHQSPTSPQQTINDMISTSTVAAGPSVQFVERMSSTVRRLESEKVATKEDMARLSAQRDEARAEIMALMREIKEKRAADSKVAALQTEVEQIKSRYDAALEMLGEKSEQLDEARSDIDDLKAMYRELVERTVK